MSFEITEANVEQHRKAIIEAAKKKYEEEGSIEIDDNAELSTSDDGDPGVYVQAWVWVYDEDVDVEEDDYESQWEDFLNEDWCEDDMKEFREIKRYFDKGDYEEAWARATMLDTLLRDSFPDDIWNKMHDEVEG